MGFRSLAVSLVIGALATSVPRVALASSLASVATQIADSIRDAPQGTWVVAAPAASDVPGVRADELAVRVAGLVAGRIGKGARPHDRAAPLSSARAHPKDVPALLFLTPSIDKGKLVVTADLFAVARNGWDRIRMPPLAPRAHAFGQAPVDAEVRAYLPAILLEQAAISKVKIDDPEVLAAACGDGNGDGGLEVALVSRTKVSVGRFAGGRFHVESSAPWSLLAPRLPVPLRDPIATATFDPDDRLLVGITDRGGVAVGLDLGSSSRLRGLPLSTAGESACATPVPAASALEGAGSCSPLGAATPRIALPTPRFDAIAAAKIVARDGSESSTVAAREPQGKVRVRFGVGVGTGPGNEGETRVLEGGAELAVFDLDLDGAPEVAVSSDSPTEDAITIYSLARGAEPRLRRRIPVNAPVRALAVCPPEAKAAPGLLAVVGTEVWLVR